MARSWISGAETGAISETGTPGTGCSVQSSVVRTGAYAFSCTSTGAFFDAPTYTVDTAIYSGYFRVPTLPSANNVFMQAVNGATGLATLQMTSTGTIRILNGSSAGTLLGTTTTAVSVDTWYLAELKVDCGTSSNGTIELKIWDDNWTSGPTLLETKTYSSITTASSLVGGCGFGFRTSALTIYWDDITTEHSSTYPGPHRIIARQPITGTPTYNAWTKTGSDPYWAATPYETSHYMTSTSGTNIRQTKLVGSFSSTQTGHGSETIASGDTIQGGVARFALKVSSTMNLGTYAMTHRISSTDYDSTIVPTTSVWITDGLQLGAASLTNLNSMEVGGVQLTSGASLFTIYDAWVMVEYVPVTNDPPTIAPNTADAQAFTTSTPALAFTGSDADSDDLRYNIQIDTANTFNAQTNTMHTKTVRPTSFTDASSAWTNEANAYDADTGTYTNNSDSTDPGDLLLNGFSHGLSSTEEIFSVKLYVKISGTGITDDHGRLGIAVGATNNSIFNFWDNSGGHAAPTTYVAEVVANPNSSDGLWTKADFNNMAVYYATQLLNSTDTIDVRIYDVYVVIAYYNSTNTSILSVYSTAALDGDVRDTNNDGNGDTVDASSVNGWVGIDYVTATKQEYRWFTSFDISSLPGGATILDAAVQLTQDNCYRDGQLTNPGARWPNIIGNLVADHVNYGATLTTGAFQQAAITSAIATVGESNRADDGTGVEDDVRTIGFTSGVATAVAADITAARTRTQFRLRFDAGIAGAANSDNFIGWITADFSTASPGMYHPRLRVLYSTAGVPLLDKLSGTDTGFSGSPDNSDPFAAGQQVSYTVQAEDALANGTYYWHARCLDPSGTNTYSSWTTTRSFTVTTDRIPRHGFINYNNPGVM